jgi:hypothetical protein
VVIDDFDIVGCVFEPPKADPPLIVYADAVLTNAIASQGLEPVAWWYAQVVQKVGSLKNHEFAVRQTLKCRTEALRRLAKPHLASVRVGERCDHLSIITRCAIIATRYY